MEHPLDYQRLWREANVPIPILASDRLPAVLLTNIAPGNKREIAPHQKKNLFLYPKITQLFIMISFMAFSQWIISLVNCWVFLRQRPTKNVSNFSWMGHFYGGIVQISCSLFKIQTAWRLIFTYSRHCQKALKKKREKPKECKNCHKYLTAKVLRYLFRISVCLWAFLET